MSKPPTNLRVYVAICLLANYKERTGDPDWEEISGVTNLSRTVIYRALSSLRKAGIVFLREDGMYDLPMDNPCGKQSQSRDSDPEKSQSRDSESQSRDATVPIAGLLPLYTEGSESSSEPKKKTTPKRGSQISTDFSITPSMRSWAIGKNIKSNLESETEKFIDHWTAKGETKKDWVAAWRLWIRNADEYRERRTKYRNRETGAEAVLRDLTRDMA